MNYFPGIFSKKDVGPVSKSVIELERKRLEGMKETFLTIIEDEEKKKEKKKKNKEEPQKDENDKDEEDHARDAESEEDEAEKSAGQVEVAEAQKKQTTDSTTDINGAPQDHKKKGEDEGNGEGQKARNEVSESRDKGEMSEDPNMEGEKENQERKEDVEQSSDHSGPTNSEKNSQIPPGTPKTRTNAKKVMEELRANFWYTYYGEQVIRLVSNSTWASLDVLVCTEGCLDGEVGNGSFLLMVICV